MKYAIFIPGLQLEPKEPNLEKYAIRLKKAIDINDPEPLNRYELKMSKEKFGARDQEEVDVATIKMHNGGNNGKEVELYKIYKFDYAPLLIKEFEQSSAFKKCIYLIWTLLSGFHHFLLPLFRKAKDKTLSTKYQIQALYVLFVLSVISLFIITLLPSAIALLLEAFTNVHETLKALGLEKLIQKAGRNGITADKIKHVSQFLLAISAFIYLLRPSWKATVSILATEFLCLNSYLRYSERKAIITGKFSTLLEYLVETNPDADQVEIHAYSFGSIVSYDVIFPFGVPPTRRIETVVNQLITIGSPHDFIQNYYPGYFSGRENHPLALTRWYNVYSQADILSSNFRNDDRMGPAILTIVPDGIRPQNINFESVQSESLNFWDYVWLYVLKIHSSYWDTDEDGTSCLTNVVQAIAANNVVQGQNRTLAAALE